MKPAWATSGSGSTGMLLRLSTSTSAISAA